jgi:hypothetical protein
VGSRGGAGQEERRRGSPRRSGDGGAAGSGRCGGVPVGGRLRRGGDVLGAVLRLAMEAGKVVAGTTSERDGKHGVGGDPSGGGRQRPFKGGRRDAHGGGDRGVGRRVEAERGRARGPGRGGGQSRAFPRYSGGTHAARTRMTDKRGRASTGPGGQRRGAGRAGQRDATPTRGPVLQCARFSF